MSVWDDIVGGVDDSSTLQRLEPLLDRVADDDGAPEDVLDDDGDPWRVWEGDVGGNDPLTIIPGTSTAATPAAGQPPATTGMLVMPDPSVRVRTELALDAIGGTPTGGVRITVTTPGLVFRPPRLVPAVLDATGQLRPDTSRQFVEFHLPRVRIRIERPSGGAFSTRLLGAAVAADDPGPDRLYEFIRMEPPYALSGPDATFGFGFRSAVLDMSDTDTPSSGGDDAISMPPDWQGLWLPEARIFVAPSGLQGIAVNAGVRDLYVGIGDDGLSGEFQVEVVERGGTPRIRLRIHTPTGESIPIADDATTAAAPAGSTLVADASGGLAPHTHQIVVGGAAPVTADRAPLGDLATPVNVTVTVTDAMDNAETRALTVDLRTTTRPGDGDDPPVTNPARLTPGAPADVAVAIVRQTDTTVTLHAPGADGMLTWTTPTDEQITPADGEFTVAVSADRTVVVTVRETVEDTDTVVEDCYFTFASPEESETLGEALDTYRQNRTKTAQQPQVGQRDSLRAPYFRDGAQERFERYGDATWQIDGFASYENRPEKRGYNRRLSARRMLVLQSLLTEFGVSNVTLGSDDDHHPDTIGARPNSGSGEWRRATATGTVTSTVTLEGAVSITRDASPTPATDDQVDQVPAEQGRPACFRKIGVRVRIEQDVFTRLEIYGEFDLETAAESRLPEATNDLPRPATSPADGIVNFLIGLKLAADRSSWEVRGEFRGDDADLDGLVRWADSAGDDTALNIVGGVAIMAPLMAVATPPTPGRADLVPMVLIGATAGALGAANVLRTHSLILRGIELVVADTAIDAADPDGPTRTTVTLLFDIETEFSFNASIIEIDPARPVTTRYRAIGVRAGWDEVDDGTGPDYVPVPVFDASRGYTLDIPAGSMSATPPLDELLRILGVQVSRSNPPYLEVELGLGLDLGIISVDSARLRVELEAPPFPPPFELTKLAASIEIPGALHGKGSVSITDTGISGALDVTLTSINLRASATVTVARHPTDGYTGVLVGAEVEFPVPLVLGSSGLGIFGFSGGVAINYRRDSGTEPTDALQWVHTQLAAGGVMDGSTGGWILSPDSFGVAAGMLVGTLEGGFLLHLKGMLLVEIPGPRLLLIMKADVLSLPPVLGAEQSATFLAVLDLDLARGTLTIAIVAEYTIVEILHIRVPVTAFFPLEGATNTWFIDLGSFDDPVRVSILGVFEGTGYLMIHGAGIDHPTLGVQTHGLTIATGFHLRQVLMGSTDIGLYLLATAGFDALMAFEPMFLAGRIYVSGELRLFIVSIGASAELQVRVGQENPDVPAQQPYVFGEVCGKVDFFFFSVKGCVSLKIGDPPQMPPAPNLVAGVTLVGRGPLLIEGDGAERIVDGQLGVAVEGDASGVAAADRVIVPIDAIPVVAFTATPDLAPGGTVLGEQPTGPSGAGFTGGWVKRGDLWARYRIASITLLEGTPELDGMAEFDPGDDEEVPSTWWTRHPIDAALPDSLALLSWTPDPTPHALPYGETRAEGIHREWDVCTPAPPPAPSLWTFDGQQLGPDPTGWHLRGVIWPDPPDTLDVARPRVDVHVTEPWRTGDAVADLLGPSPATVVGDHVACTEDEPILIAVDALDDGLPPSGASGASHPGGLDGLAEALADGHSLHDAAAVAVSSTWDPTINPEAGGCEGRILEAPIGEDETPPAIGPPEDLRRVEQAWELAGHEPNELRNTVRVTPTSPLLTASVLLLAPVRQLAIGSLVVRSVDVDGGELARVHVTDAERVGTGVFLLDEWLDPGLGPWADPARRAARVAARVAGAAKNREFDAYDFVFVEVPEAGPLTHVDIGWDREADRSHLPYFVVAMSGLPLAEAERHQRQSDYQQGWHDVVETALTQDPTDHALLTPGRSYTVSVEWESQTVEQEEEPTTPPSDWDDGPTPRSERQSFTFWTVEPDAAPDDLGPWLLATAPTTGEHGVLCRQPVRMALATQNVAKLFAAHDRELVVRVRAASGSHPPAPDGEPGGLVAIPIVVGGIRRPLAPGITIESGFHKALREHTDELPCIDPGPAPVPDEIYIRYDFDPLTEYLIDVYAKPTSAPDVVDAHRIHRISFTTSRFDDVADLADLVRFGPIEDVAATNPAELTALGEYPTGAELDERFVGAGLDTPEVPRFPRTQIVWGERGGDVEPIAVVVEISETLWRSRDLPTEQMAPTDSDDPVHTWWVRSPQQWLRVETGGDAVVQRIVQGPGETRAVILLAPGQRGRTLDVDLVVPENEFWRSADDPMDGAEQRASMGSHQLLRPIWEVED